MHLSEVHLVEQLVVPIWQSPHSWANCPIVSSADLFQSPTQIQCPLHCSCCQVPCNQCIWASKAFRIRRAVATQNQELSELHCKSIGPGGQLQWKHVLPECNFWWQWLHHHGFSCGHGKSQKTKIESPLHPTYHGCLPMTSHHNMPLQKTRPQVYRQRRADAKDESFAKALRAHQHWWSNNTSWMAHHAYCCPPA